MLACTKTHHKIGCSEWNEHTRRLIKLNWHIVDYVN